MKVPMLGLREKKTGDSRKVKEAETSCELSSVPLTLTIKPTIVVTFRFKFGVLHVIKEDPTTAAFTLTTD
jgi:hypothetical protein